MLVGVVSSGIGSRGIEGVEGLRFAALFLEFREAANVSVAVLVCRYRCHDVQKSREVFLYRTPSAGFRGVLYAGNPPISHQILRQPRGR